MIRVISRLGRGYSFEAMRAKILFKDEIAKKNVPGYRKANQIYSMADMLARGGHIRLREEREKNYGTDMVALVKMIEDGEF